MAVTGLGVICAPGNDTSETWNAVCEGRSGIAPIHSIDVSKLRFRYGAQVCRYDPSKYFEADHARLLDPFSQFAIIAAHARSRVLPATVVTNGNGGVALAVATH